MKVTIRFVSRTPNKSLYKNIALKTSIRMRKSKPIAWTPYNSVLCAVKPKLELFIR